MAKEKKYFDDDESEGNIQEESTFTSDDGSSSEERKDFEELSGSEDWPPRGGDDYEGYSQEEIKDVNAISVTVADKTTPIVILYGPPACGKTMTLVRMTRWLQTKGYTVSPVRNFRPSNDLSYTKMCDTFNSLVHSQKAAESTNAMNFMLVCVYDKTGKSVCHLLEAPGEHYFFSTDGNANGNYPRYIENIIRQENRKIWLIMLEPAWKDPSDRQQYVQRIATLRHKQSQKDFTVFVYNKIDELPHLVRAQGSVNEEAALKSAKDNYPGILVPFKSEIPILKWFKPYLCDFVTFSTGTFHEDTTDGSHYFEDGPDAYPRNLWQIIQKNIRG